MDQKVSASAIDNAKASIVDVIGGYVPLEKQGAEFSACCPFHDEKTPSFTVNPSKQFFYCFGCGASGDAIDFVTLFESCGFRDAMSKISGELPQGDHAPTKPARTAPEDEWEPVTPVPRDLKKRPMNVLNRKIDGEWHRMAASARWAYRDIDGEIIGLIYRFERPGGGKEVMPQTYCRNTKTGEFSWRWRSFEKPRPLYGLEKLKKHPNAQVLLAEGEKAADAGQLMFREAGVDDDKLIVLSWPGGGKAVDKTDWAPLHGRKLGLWPDADLKKYVAPHPEEGRVMPFIKQPGTMAMLAIYDRLKDACPEIKFILPPEGVEDGWDLADAGPEFKVLAHVKEWARPAADVAMLRDVPEPEPQQAEPPPWDEAPMPTPDDLPPEDYHNEPPSDGPADDEPEDDLVKNGFFTILGYDGGHYYLFQHEKRQVLTLSKGDLSDIGLIEVAPANWWEEHFPAKNGVDRKAAANWLFRTANSRGIYDPSRVRGRGAWIDRGRHIFHHGDYLTVDGERADITRINSAYVYPMARRMPEPAKTAMSDAEGRHLCEVAKRVRWTMPASAPLICGWTFLAPIGGTLKWRPHVWITGAAGSGKSSVQRDFCAQLVGSGTAMAAYAQGNSTEAGIRQELRADAVPVLIDELESNDERERQRVESILSLVRQSSSESQAKVFKGTLSGSAMNFHIRSMFCLASINTKLDKKADIDRITRLAIRPPAMSGSDEDQWVELEEELHKIATDETIAQRMLARALNMLPIIQQNVRTFTKVAAKHFGTQRDGDQFGTLLAGTWSLCNSTPATEKDAEALITAYGWHEHTEDQEQDDSVRAMQSILSSKIRMPGSIGDLTVYELARETSSLHREGLCDAIQAENTLKRHGIVVDPQNGILLFGVSCSALHNLVRGSSFATDLRGQLLRVPGAERHNKVVSINGVKTRCVSVPLSPILGEQKQDFFDDDPM